MIKQTLPSSPNSGGVAKRRTHGGQRPGRASGSSPYLVWQPSDELWFALVWVQSQYGIYTDSGIWTEHRRVICAGLSITVDDPGYTG